MDRRNSIKTGSAIGLGILASYPGILKNEDKKLGVALVGLGGYATAQIAPALLECSNCELKGIVSGTAEKRMVWKEKYGLKAANIFDYSNFDDIGHADDIDIVYIVLPNFMHAEYTIRALKAGKHVICEKPMGMNAEECRQMIKARNESGKMLQIGYRLYYEEKHLFAHTIAAEGKLGKHLAGETSLAFRMANPDIWRMDPAKGGGGAVMDLGVYCIQGARRMANSLPESVTAQGYVFDTNLFKGIYETVSFQLTFPGGSMSNSTTSFNARFDRAYAGYENGSVTLDPAFNAAAPVGLKTSPEMQIPVNSPNFQQTRQMDHFALNILQKTEVLASGEEGLTDMIIIDAIKKAIQTGGEIPILFKF